MSLYLIAIEAIQDLDEISDYFVQRNIGAGEALLDEFTKKCRYLAQFPQIGRSYADLKPGLRGMPLGRNYIIFYRLLPDGIEIMRVLRGDRDLEAVFDTEN